MAKKGNRQIFNLACSVCKNKNYLISKNTINIKDKLIFKFIYNKTDKFNN